jgi:hypothetical protein
VGNLDIEKSREREREKARKRASECDYFVVLKEANTEMEKNEKFAPPAAQ